VTSPDTGRDATPVFDLAHLVEITETAAEHGFRLDDRDRAALDQARDPHTVNGLDDVLTFPGRKVSLPLYMRGLAVRALLHRM
jgi:hypothetical protein